MMLFLVLHSRGQYCSLLSLRLPSPTTSSHGSPVCFHLTYSLNLLHSLLLFSSDTYLIIASFMTTFLFFIIIIVTEVHFGLACLFFGSSPDHLEFQTYHSQLAWGFSQGKSKQCTPHTIVLNVITLATIKICIDNQIFLYKVSVSN